MEVYLRALSEEDAETSYRWRNDPEIWIYTGSRPNRVITPEIEREWARMAILQEQSRRFAICLEGTHEYVGNAQLTNIDSGTAELHIFIGARNYWGKGIATKATNCLIGYARDILKLRNIHLEVNRANTAAIRAYEKNGFLTDTRSDCTTSPMVKMCKHL
jgi:RimJ/RimL family protein N-acetyltransferase